MTRVHVDVSSAGILSLPVHLGPQHISPPPPSSLNSNALGNCSLCCGGLCLCCTGFANRKGGSPSRNWLYAKSGSCWMSRAPIL